MSKNVRKKLKSLTQHHQGWKKVHYTSDDTILSHKLKGLKKLLPSMGNFTSNPRWHNYTIENLDEHATKLMAALNELREEGAACDVVFTDSESKPAHKIVLSFNQTLLQICESSSSTVTVTIEGNEHEKPTQLQTEENAINSETDCNGYEKNEKLLSSCVDTGLSEEIHSNESIEEKENGLISELTTIDLQLDQTANEVISTETSSENLNGAHKMMNGDSNESLTEISPPIVSEISAPIPTEVDSTADDTVPPYSNEPLSTEESQQALPQNTVKIEVDENFHPEKYNSVTSEDLNRDAPPLLKLDDNKESLCVSIEENLENAKKSDLDKNFIIENQQEVAQASSSKSSEENVCESSSAFLESLDDPKDVLINFLYTSHIDITQKNVSALKELALQCGMNDVITACEEFSKVLQMETEHLSNEKEKLEVEIKFRYRYSDPSMPAKMLQHFEKLRGETRFTDVKLRSFSGKVILDAHSLVLTCCSPFFQTLTASQTTGEELDITEVEEDILEPIMNFIYSGKIEVAQQTVSKLIQAADRLQLSDVVEGCAEFLESTTTNHNCIQYRNMAIDYKCNKLKVFTDKFVAENFLAVAKTPDFMTLSVSSLIELTSQDDLVVNFPLAKGEMDVFNAIRRWILHDEDSRQQHLAEVMASVRFPLLNSDNLVNNITTDLLVMSSKEMCNRITDVITSIPFYYFSEPVSMRGKECILTVGGSYPIADETSEERGYQAVNYSSKFTIYDPASATFNELTSLPETRALHCVAAADQFVFVVGGYDPHSCITNSAYCFDLASGKWNALPSMKISRSCFSLHVTRGYIYAIGGLTPKGYTSSCERLDRKRKTWELTSPLAGTRYRHAGCVLNDTIYISGGNDKEDAVFSLSSDVDSWKKESPLNVGRHSHVMQTVNNVIYAMCGEEIPFSAESFKNKTWTLLPQPLTGPVALYLPGCTALNDRIFLCGGWEKEDTVVFCNRFYNTTTCSWKETHKMPVPRGSAASCTIRIPKSYWKVKFLPQKDKPASPVNKP